jgi:hypothetical protein
MHMGHYTEYCIEVAVQQHTAFCTVFLLLNSQLTLTLTLTGYGSKDPFLKNGS